MARPTLKSISERTGLSLTTISRALKDGPEVKPETIAKVKKVAEELGYRPHPSGVSLRTGKTFVICAILPMIKPGEVIGDLGTLPLIEGLTAGLKGTDYNLMVLPQVSEQDPLEPVRYVVEKGLADAVVINLTEHDDQRVRYLHDNKFPFVTFGRTELSFEHPYYDTDSTDFVYRAASLLYGRGRRNLKLVSADEKYTFSWHRFSGLRRAALEYGIEVSREANVLEESDSASYRQFALDHARDDNAPDGYICGTEVEAMALMSGLQAAGIQLGEEVDIVSQVATGLMDNLDSPIWTCYQDLHHIGRELVSLLLKRIDGEAAEKLQRLEKVEFRHAPSAKQQSA